MTRLSIVSGAFLLLGDHIEEEEIYELHDPRDGKIRYVGRSIDPWKRWYQHLSNPQKGRMSDWITELKTLGLLPLLHFVCRAPRWNAGEIEKQTIAKRLFEGHDLYNQTYKVEPVVSAATGTGQERRRNFRQYYG